MTFFPDWKDCPFPDWMAEEEGYTDDKQDFYEAWHLVENLDGKSLDEIMETMKHWYRPDTVVRDEMFNISHYRLVEQFGEYWKHPQSPWTPNK